MNQTANRLIGKMIRGYCLEELLACEDATATYRARTQELWQVPELLITVLLLPEHFSSERRSRFKERFLREAQRIATLRHHYLLPLYGCGEQDGLLYWIGPYMIGETLADQQRQNRRWAPDEALSLLRPLATVLDYIHEQGLAYQFLEPAHIILQNSLTIQLGGLGKRSLMRKRGLEEESQPSPAYEYLKSITGEYLGSPQYIAPEVLKGAEADRRSDVYSLGVLLCELLSGQPMFVEQNYVDIVEKHVREPLPPLRELAPDLPASLELVLNRALSRNPERRFQRPAALLNAYSQMLDLRVQTPAPVALVQQVKEMFALPPAEQNPNLYLPAPRPKLQRPTLLPTRPERVMDKPVKVAQQSFSAHAAVPAPRAHVVEEETPQVAATGAEETLLVRRDQLMAQLRKPQTEHLPSPVVQGEAGVREKGKRPFGDTDPRLAAHMEEEDVAPQPIVYAGGKAISAVDAILQVDTPLSSEIEHDMDQLAQEVENPFEQELEESPFEKQGVEAVPAESQPQVPPQAPRRASIELLYQGNTESTDQEMVTEEVVTEGVAILPISPAGIEPTNYAERSPVHTDAALPLVQSTRTHVMAMASQLQQMKERLQEQSKATGIRRLDDSGGVQDETVRQALYRP
jgi:serine/threonine protein kinase